MTKWQSVKSILSGVLMILVGVLIILKPEAGYPLAIAIISLGLMLDGLRALIYYFTMARHMVGGKQLLFRGVILLDIGFFPLTLSQVPELGLLLYLVIVHAFSGGVDILRALEARKFGAPSWRLKLAYGAANVVLAVLCLFCLKNTTLLVYIYGAGLIYSAILRIVSAVRKTAIVYIQ